MKIKSMFYVLLISVIIMSNSNASSQSLIQTENYLNVSGGKTWYKVFGEGNGIPIVLIHGGPGGTSYYLNPLAELGKNRPVIFYDQLGCGRSDRITDTSLMTVEHYVEELHALITHLGLKEFYLYGQSWGTTIALEYYSIYPDGVKGIIFSSPYFNTSLWEKDARILLRTLPDSVQEEIRKNEENGTYDSPEYQAAVMQYYEKFVARKKPWSKDIEDSFAGMGANVYYYMVGPNEFTWTGTLKNYDGIDKLPRIKVPTLFIAGEFDEARPETAKYFQSLVPNSQFEMTKGAAHMTIQDSPGEDIKVISNFITNIEK